MILPLLVLSKSSASVVLQLVQWFPIRDDGSHPPVIEADISYTRPSNFLGQRSQCILVFEDRCICFIPWHAILYSSKGELRTKTTKGILYMIENSAFPVEKE